MWPLSAQGIYSEKASKKVLYLAMDSEAWFKSYFWLDLEFLYNLGRSQKNCSNFAMIQIDRNVPFAWTRHHERSVIIKTDF